MSLVELQAAIEQLPADEYAIFCRWLDARRGDPVEEGYTEWFREQVDAAIHEADQGQTISDEEARRHFGLTNQ